MEVLSFDLGLGFVRFYNSSLLICTTEDARELIKATGCSLFCGGVREGRLPFDEATSGLSLHIQIFWVECKQEVHLVCIETIRSLFPDQLYCVNPSKSSNTHECYSDKSWCPA